MDLAEMVVSEAAVTEVTLKVGRLDQEEVDMVAEAADMAVDILDARGDWDRVVDCLAVDEDSWEVAV